MAISATRPQWNSVRAVWRRSVAGADPDGRLSIADGDVPNWQREGTAWNKVQKGMLALSILQGYPIGQILLWEKPGKVYVPIDGRQRLSAMLEFRKGNVSIPTAPWVPSEFRGLRYCTSPTDDHDHAQCLTVALAERFDEYVLDVLSYPPETPEPHLMDIFVRLQGGSPLTKAEVRAALGTEVARFVTEVTASRAPASEDEEQEEDSSTGHPFFAALSAHYLNRRKSHRQVCDQLLNEFLAGKQEADFNLDHHWESLTSLYRTKDLSKSEREGFRVRLGAFRKAFTTKGRLSTALNNPNTVSTWYRVFESLQRDYVLPSDLLFGTLSEEFEAKRKLHKEDEPYRAYAAALAASGYTAERNKQRARLLREWILARHPAVAVRDPKRLFSRDQKYVIWHRADGRCEWLDDDSRCSVEIPAPSSPGWHADHVVMWKDGGPTSIDNGRLLCTPHNLARRD